MTEVKTESGAMMKAESVPRRHAAEHIRAALKVAFPATRFWVRCAERGWSDVYVIRWGDGPSEDEVHKLASALESVRVLIHCDFEQTA
jgi:hypothetical protein